MSAQKPTVVVFGATGGCALRVLISSIEGGHNSIAFVRNESKLTNLLSTKNVSAELIKRHLTVVTGDAKDTTALSKALFHPSLPNGTPDIIVSGVGQMVTFKPNPLRPTLPDPNICEDATKAVLKALHEGLKPAMKKPIFLAISTTGISDHGRDIPLAMVPLYHWMLPVPHEDKKKMEKLLENEVAKPDSALGGFVVVRASLLTDGPLLGVDAIRSDVEDGGVAANAVGYTISRDDVGNWIYRSVVAATERVGGEYVNKYVGITY